MTPREFFWLVAEMRGAQDAYFKTRAPSVLRAARKLEGEVDREIRRVRQILATKDSPESVSHQD